MATLFTPAQPLWISRNSRIQYVENPDGTLDISTFVADPLLRPGEIYQVKSSVSAPTVSELRQAGDNYPDWVKGRYLKSTGQYLRSHSSACRGIDRRFGNTIR